MEATTYTKQITINDEVFDAHVTIQERVGSTWRRPERATLVSVGLPTEIETFNTASHPTFPRYDAGLSNDEFDAQVKTWSRAKIRAERAVVKLVLDPSDLDVLGEWTWDRTAGCGCGCSPAFRSNVAKGQWMFINVGKTI